MSVQGTSVGSIFVELGARFRGDGFDRYEAALKRAIGRGRDAEDKTHRQQLGVGVDRTGFQEHGDRLGDSERKTRDTARRTKLTRLGVGVDRSGFDQFSRALDGAARRAQTVNRAINRGIVVGGTAAAYSLYRLSKAGIAYNATLEQNVVAFKNFLGTGEKAKAFLSDLQEINLKTPFDLPGITRAAQRLLAFGFEAEKTKQMLVQIGDAAAGLGTGAEGIDRITTAIGQIQAKGRVQGDELLQLTEAGIPAYQILQRELGLTGDQVKRIGELGIPATEAIDALLRGMDKRFKGSAEEQSKTFNGMMSNLRDAMNMTLGSMTRGLFEEIHAKWLPALNDAASEIRDIWDTPGLTPDQKFEASWKAIERTGLPDRVKQVLVAGFKWVADRIGPVLATGLSKAAEKAPEILASAGIAAGKAFLNAFNQASTSGKIALATLVGLRLLGPLSSAVKLLGSLRGGLGRLFGGRGGGRGGGGLLPTATGSILGATPATAMWVRVVGGMPGGGPVAPAPGPAGGGKWAGRAAQFGRVALRAGGGAVTGYMLADAFGLGGADKWAATGIGGLAAINPLLGGAAAAGWTGGKLLRRNATVRRGANSVAGWAMGDPGSADRIEAATAAISKAANAAKPKTLKAWRGLAKAAVEGIKDMPADAQERAKASTIRMTAALERNGKAPRGATRALAQGMIREWGKIPPAAKAAADRYGVSLGKVAVGTTEASNRNKMVLSRWLDSIRSWGGSVTSFLSDVAGKVTGFLSRIGGGLESARGTVRGWISSGAGKVAGLVGLSTGGRTVGPGHDHIPVMLRGDERVLNPSQFGGLSDGAKAEVEASLASAPVISSGGRYATGGRPRGSAVVRREVADVTRQLKAKEAQLAQLTRSRQGMAARTVSVPPPPANATWREKAAYLDRKRAIEAQNRQARAAASAAKAAASRQISALQAEVQRLRARLDKLSDELSKKQSPEVPGARAFEDLLTSARIKAGAKTGPKAEEQARQNGVRLYSNRIKDLQRLLRQPRYARAVWPEMWRAIREELASNQEQLKSLREGKPEFGADAIPGEAAWRRKESSWQSRVAAASATEDEGDDEAARKIGIGIYSARANELRAALKTTRGALRELVQAELDEVNTQIGQLRQAAPAGPAADATEFDRAIDDERRRLSTLEADTGRAGDTSGLKGLLLQQRSALEGRLGAATGDAYDIISGAIQRVNAELIGINGSSKSAQDQLIDFQRAKVDAYREFGGNARPAQQARTVTQNFTITHPVTDAFAIVRSAGREAALV